MGVWRSTVPTPLPEHCCSYGSQFGYLWGPFCLLLTAKKTNQAVQIIVCQRNRGYIKNLSSGVIFLRKVFVAKIQNHSIKATQDAFFAPKLASF